MTQDANPIVIAHRAASAYLPEHTLPAVAMAHAMGADFIEQDVVLTKDNVPVVLHDIYLDTVSDVAERFPGRRRADGRYYALDFTLVEIKRLRVTERCHAATGRQVFANRFPKGLGCFEIPTLEEELRLIRGLNHSTGRIAGIYPELKQPAWHRRQGHDVSRIVLPLLRRHGYASKADACWLQCFDLHEVKRLRAELDWQGRLVLLLERAITARQLAGVAQAADGIGPAISLVISGRTRAARRVTDLVGRAHAHHLAVHAWTVRLDDLPKFAASSDDLMNLLFTEARVDGVFSDFPDVTVRWLGRSK
jgi:glycerophosphoryl diester phosphodiesterase